MFRSTEIVPFPGSRFAEGWRLTEGAAIDSLLAEPFEAVPDTIEASED
jgi:hypothetical protein